MAERYHLLESIRSGVLEIGRKARSRGEPVSTQLEGLSFNAKVSESDALWNAQSKSKRSSSWLNRAFEVLQGVTWGGKDAERVFVIGERGALEPELTPKTIGGRDVLSGKIVWQGSHLVFPYFTSGPKWTPAFKGLLDLETARDRTEAKLIGRPSDLLNHRIATLGNSLARYANVATHLVNHYDSLRQREFEGRVITECGKDWYEYHRPRTPTLITTPKIVARRLPKTPMFAVDREGFLPRDSVICLVPKWGDERLRKLVKHSGGQLTALEWIVDRLSSQTVQKVFDAVRSKKRGGYVILGEDLLSQIPDSLFSHR
jgi:hypothetical protein